MDALDDIKAVCVAYALNKINFWVHPLNIKILLKTNFKLIS